MESWLCIVGGACLIASSYFLSRLRPPDWSADGELAPQIGRSFARWSVFQHIIRRCNNILLALAGLLICATGFVAHGRAWLVLWLLVLLLVMLIVLLASLDAFSSMAGYRRAIPEAAAAV